MKIKSSEFFLSKLTCDDFMSYTKNDMIELSKEIEKSLENIIGFKHFVNVCIFFKQLCKFYELELIKKEGIHELHFEIIKSYGIFTNDSQRFSLVCMNSDIVNSFCSHLNRIMEYHVNWNMSKNLSYLKFSIDSSRPYLIFKYLLSESLAHNLNLEFIS